MGTRSAVLLQALLGAITSIMVHFSLRVAFLATAALAAPAADADADPFYGYGHGLGFALHAPLVALPVCKVVPKTVVVGQQCHAEPECTTETVVLGKKIVGQEEPVCTDVKTVVPAVVGAYGAHLIGKREAEAEADADAQFYHAAPLAVSHKIVTKHCAPGAPILEDVTQDVTTCVPKPVCTDVEAVVHETVCGEPAAAEAEAAVEAVAEA